MNSLALLRITNLNVRKSPINYSVTTRNRSLRRMSPDWPMLKGDFFSLEYEQRKIQRISGMKLRAFIPFPNPWSYGSPIFKAVQKKRYKALYRALTKSPKSPEYAVGAGSEPSHIAQ